METDTIGAVMIGMIWTAMSCVEHDQQLAGMRPVSRSYYDIKGRPDEHLWMEARDKEIKNCLRWARSQLWMRLTFLLSTRVSTVACLSRSKKMATVIYCSIAHAATPTAGSKR